MSEPQKAVVVTGVSTGIGWGTAKVLLDAKIRVFGSVRKDADAQRLRAEFGSSFTPLIFDVTDEKAVRAAADDVRAALGGQKLFGLVNNAGVAVAGPLLKLPIAAFREQIDVNLSGAVTVTQAFAPLLGSEPGLEGAPGRIINISSVGGRVSMPFLAPYHASKFGLEGLSESLRRELLPFGIDVVVVAPGGVITTIWDKAEKVDTAPYRDSVYAKPLERVRAFMLASGRAGLKPETLGRAILKALTVRRPKVRYSVAPDPVQTFMLAHLPKRMVDRMIGGQLGLLPGSNEDRA